MKRDTNKAKAAKAMAALGGAGGSGEHYSEEAFASKISGMVPLVGRKVLCAAFILHELLKSKDTPLWAKAAIVAALGYLILPLDAIPDVIPLAGFTDDAGVMTALLAVLDAYVTDEIRERAEKRLPERLRKKP